LPQPGQSIQAYKVSKRFDSDISALCAGLCLTLDGTVVKDVRLAFGGLAAVVRRAPLAEAAMKGQPWSRTTLAAAQAALAQDFQPLSDLRASAVYRLRVAQNLLERFWLETGSGTPPAPQPISVWPQRQDEGRP
jgi:xanthine dehydrogenase small subunit